MTIRIEKHQCVFVPAKLQFGKTRYVCFCEYCGRKKVFDSTKHNYKVQLL